MDNRNLEETMKEHQIHKDRGGKLSEDDFALLREMRDKARENGRLGWEWFLSREEFLDWWRSVHQHAPVNCWL